MNIAATSVSMDAAQTSREMEQRINGVSMTSGLPTGQSDAFGIRLASMLASSTQTHISCRSEISPVCGGIPPLDASTAARTEATKTVLSQLTEQVIGQQVTLSALEDQLTSFPGEQAASPLFRLGTAQLMSGMVCSEQESLLFSAQGMVETTDGRHISFDLGLSMQRSTVAVQTASLGITPLFIDPLILQFELDAPLLGDSTFLFDLDSDGTQEDLACPGGGCGFLAFDRNSDGVINNGLELFGPDSGSGFGELAELDGDGNQWIDESDPFFDRLLIWTPDGQGGESLRSLKEAGVGAIAVTHAGTSFQLQQTDGTALGTIKASGLFLTEDGEVRSLHEVDLALPSTVAESTTAPLAAASTRFESTLQALRDIISMQRMRLRMMLTGERLRGAMARREEQHNLFFGGLQARSEWQALVERMLEQQHVLAGEPTADAGRDTTSSTRYPS